MQLFTRGESSPKLSHLMGELRLESVVLYLAPASTVEGINVCSAASPFCRDLCLYVSGRVEIERATGNRKIEACRVRRTEWFRDDCAGFMAQLHRELLNLRKRASVKNALPTVRLNGTSDILWEHIPYEVDGIRYANIMQAFPDVQFYDYTKVPSRVRAFAEGKLPANYHLTFSLSESNDRIALRALAAGMNVAVPMHIRKHQIPETFSGCETVDGDRHDYRFLDPQGGRIVCLSPKGRAAKKDRTSGFIKDPAYTLNGDVKVTFATAA